VTEVFRIHSGNIARVEAEHELNGLPLPAYRRAAQLPWIDHSRPYAHALLDGGRFHGWVHSFYADRVIGGRHTTVLNLSAWWVSEEYRAQSLRLMFAALHDAGDTPVTILTPSGLAAQIYAGMKFRVMDTDRFAVPIPQGGPAAEGDPETVFLHLQPRSKKVFNDHRGFPIHHCRIAVDERACYFVYIARERFDLQVADILYLDGDLELLSGDWTPPAGSPLQACSRLLLDRRFFGGREPWGEPMNPFNPRLYRGPPELRPELDFMYSEVPLYASFLM
jgi:hypothetical protein